MRGFVNRVADLARLDAALGSLDRPGPEAVCVIAGMAGVGKTSLAVHWAHHARDRFADGQLYINLRGYDPGEPITPAQALERFLVAMGLAPNAIPIELDARTALYRSVLADKRMLVVLDNAAMVGQVRPLLPGVGGCLVLVTSRNRLSGLVARHGAYRVTLDVFDEPAAVELLHEATAGYRTRDDENELSELARLCARLPLALRIAAERAAARPRVPLSMLIHDLRDESSLWDVLSTGDDEEAGAVRTVFTWSYRALPPEAARLFRLLGLHPGADFSTYAAAALAELSEREARLLLDMLVGAHLLGQTASDRFQFHDLLRAYALDQANRQETPATQRDALRRVLTWYLHTVGAASDAASDWFREDPPLGLVPDQASRPDFAGHQAAHRWFETERANLAAVIREARDRKLDELAWQLPVTLGRYYNYRHPFDEWFAASLIGLDAARRSGSRLGEAYLLYSMGKAHIQADQPQRALKFLHASLEINRAIGNHVGEVNSLSLGLCFAYLKLRSLPQARAAAEQALVTAREHDLDEAWPLNWLASCCYEMGELEQANNYIRQAMATRRRNGLIEDDLDDVGTLYDILEELGQMEEALKTALYIVNKGEDRDSPITLGWGLNQLGRAQRMTGRHADALSSFQRSADLHHQLGHYGREAAALDGIGDVYRDLDRPAEAAAFHRRASAVHHDLGDKWREAIELNHLAIALAQADEPADARNAWMNALSLLDSFDDPKAVALRRAIHAALAAPEPN